MGLEDVRDWTRNWTAANVPLPLNGWANRMQLINNIERKIDRMRTGRILARRWFMEYVTTVQSWLAMSPTFSCIKAYVAERDHPERGRFRADPNVRGDDNR